MGEIQYDFARLAAIDNLQIAVGNFSTQTAYFNALFDFENSADSYLRSYTPSVVIYSEDMRKAFLKETKELEKKFIFLGLIYAASKLTELDAAARSGDVPALTDGLMVFFADMDILVKQVAAARVADMSAGSGAKPLILAVDDAQEMLVPLVGALCKEYNIITTDSAMAALELIETLNPDLFLIDTDMPDMNGLELAGLLSAFDAFKKTPVIFMYDRLPSDMGRLMERSGNFMEKPLDMEKLFGFLTAKLR